MHVREATKTSLNEDDYAPSIKNKNLPYVLTWNVY